MLGLFSKGDIEIKNKSEIKITLTRISKILRDNGFAEQENVVSELLLALTRDDRKEFLQIITSVDLWGGAGAVWEAGGFTNEKDEKEFWRLLITLTEQMKEIGIKCQRAYSTADILKNKLKKMRN